MLHKICPYVISLEWSKNINGEDSLAFSADVDTLHFTVNLLDYQDGLHILEIVGLTHVTEILRHTLEFYGLGKSW